MNTKIMNICECGQPIEIPNIRCEECADVVDHLGNHWYIGTTHICLDCPSSETCAVAFEKDPGNGLCPADYL